MDTSCSHVVWCMWQMLALEMIGVFSDSTPASRICAHILCTCSYRECLIIGRKEYFSLWKILFAWESTWAEGDGQKPEPVPVSIKCTDFQRQKTSMVQLKCPSVTELASNSIRTKYARGLSMVLQDWQWRLKQSFDPPHLKQAKCSPNSSSLFAQASLPAPEEPCWTLPLCCSLTWVNKWGCGRIPAVWCREARNILGSINQLPLQLV